MPSMPAAKFAERLGRPGLVFIFFLTFGTARSATDLAPVTAVVQIATPPTKNQGQAAR